MITRAQNIKHVRLPDFFKDILWSYDFDVIDPETNKKTIIVNTLNYGDLKHWHWIIDYYGKDEIRSLLSRISATELRPQAAALAGVIFSLNNFNYAPRGVH